MAEPDEPTRPAVVAWAPLPGLSAVEAEALLALSDAELGVMLDQLARLRSQIEYLRHGSGLTVPVDEATEAALAWADEMAARLRAWGGRA